MKLRQLLKQSLLASILGCMVGCIQPYVYECPSCPGTSGMSGRFPSAWDQASHLESCPHCGGFGQDCCSLSVTGKLARAMTCCAGCGDMYWGEWCYDPARGCDPCDDCGNWTGPRDCGPRGWEKIKLGLWGVRHGGCLGCESGCAACQNEPLISAEPEVEIPNGTTPPVPPAATSPLDAPQLDPEPPTIESPRTATRTRSILRASRFRD